MSIDDYLAEVASGDSVHLSLRFWWVLKVVR